MPGGEAGVLGFGTARRSALRPPGLQLLAMLRQAGTPHIGASIERCLRLETGTPVPRPTVSRYVTR